MKRNISIRNVALALVLATLVFLIGIIIGNHLSERKYDQFQSIVSDIRIQTMSMELQYDMLAEDPCAASNTTYLLTELTELTSKLDYLESIYGTDHSEILRLKQYYSILQIQHWMLFRKAKKECNSEYDIILYFYSNEGCNECKTQGVVLTAFRKKYKGKVKVYAFDKNLRDPALNTLIEIYNVAEVPTIVYNDNVYANYMSMQALEGARKGQNTLLVNDTEKQ